LRPAIQPSQLHAAMEQGLTAQPRLFRHAFNPDFLYTGGLQSLVQAAKALWLLDLVAEKMVPVYAQAWGENQVDTAVVTLDVTPTLSMGNEAQLALSFKDGRPSEVCEHIGYLDFPVGKWQIHLGTEEFADGRLVTTASIPLECRI
jgi:hypothetical protein